MCMINNLTDEAEKEFWRNVAKKEFGALFELYSKKEITIDELKEIFNFAIGETNQANKKILKKVIDG